MKRPLFIKNTPIDEKRISFIEKVVQRLSLRTHKTTLGIIPPQVISECVSGEDVRGNVIKQMLFKGSLSKLIVAFKEKPKSLICIEVNCLNEDNGRTRTFYTEKIKDILDINIDTIDGGMVTVSIHPTDDQYKITEVWLSMLWNAHVSNSIVKQHLIDNLEKEAEENERI